MTYPSVYTFGVTPTYLQAQLPQIGMEGAEDVLTSARLTILINDAAAVWCGMLAASGLDPDAINDATDTVPYILCRQGVGALVIAEVIRAISGFGAGADVDTAIQRERARADAILARIARIPPLLGAETGTAPSGIAKGVVDDTDAPANPMRWTGVVEW